MKKVFSFKQRALGQVFIPLVQSQVLQVHQTKQERDRSKPLWQKMSGLWKKSTRISRDSLDSGFCLGLVFFIFRMLFCNLRDSSMSNHQGAWLSDFKFQFFQNLSRNILKSPDSDLIFNLWKQAKIQLNFVESKCGSDIELSSIAPQTPPSIHHLTLLSAYDKLLSNIPLHTTWTIESLQESNALDNVLSFSPCFWFFVEELNHIYKNIESSQSIESSLLYIYTSTIMDLQINLLQGYQRSSKETYVSSLALLDKYGIKLLEDILHNSFSSDQFSLKSEYIHIRDRITIRSRTSRERAHLIRTLHHLLETHPQPVIGQRDISLPYETETFIFILFAQHIVCMWKQKEQIWDRTSLGSKRVSNFLCFDPNFGLWDLGSSIEDAVKTVIELISKNYLENLQFADGSEFLTTLLRATPRVR